METHGHTQTHWHTQIHIDPSTQRHGHTDTSTKRHGHTDTLTRTDTQTHGGTDTWTHRHTHGRTDKPLKAGVIGLLVPDSLLQCVPPTLRSLLAVRPQASKEVWGSRGVQALFQGFRPLLPRPKAQRIARLGTPDEQKRKTSQAQHYTLRIVRMLYSKNEPRRWVLNISRQLMCVLHLKPNHLAYVFNPGFLSLSWSLKCNSDPQVLLF